MNNDQPITPGEGWRWLVDKEPIAGTDEAYCPGIPWTAYNESATGRLFIDQPYNANHFRPTRRRIEQPAPVVLAETPEARREALSKAVGRIAAHDGFNAFIDAMEDILMDYRREGVERFNRRVGNLLHEHHEVREPNA